jgi:integral membrane protein
MPPVTTGRRTFTPERLFRVFALLETITWTLLIVAMLLKYVVGVGDWPVSIAGFVHGLIFIAYALQAAVVATNQRWHLGLSALAVASAGWPGGAASKAAGERMPRATRATRARSIAPSAGRSTARCRWRSRSLWPSPSS